MQKILQSFLANFVDPDVIKSADDITSVDFTNKSLQLNDDELGIGTSTRLLLCGEFEDLVGTSMNKVSLLVSASSMKHVFPK